MRQIFYVSKSAGMVDQAALDAIVHRSRHNNALDGVTGVLWVDGDSFAQVIEGDDRPVDDAMARIRADARHQDITLLHDRTIFERQFGSWDMQVRDAKVEKDAVDARLRETLAQAPQEVRDAFASLMPPGP